MSDATLGLIHKLFNASRIAQRDAKELLVGRSAKIVSDYNGQPYGRSAPSMRGQVKNIIDVHFDLQSGVSLLLVGCRLYIRLEEVELV